MKLNDQNKKEIIELDKQEVRVKEIARRYNCTVSSIYEVLKEYGIKKRQPPLGESGTCRTCKKIAHRDEFLSGQTVIYRHHSCRSCRNKKQDRYRKDSQRIAYGLDEDQLAQLHIKQEGLCEICRKSQERRLDADHNHKTGKLRGVLCRSCNIGIGYLQDSPELLSKAIAYLQKYDEE